jgi:hypothetical protein
MLSRSAPPSARPKPLAGFHRSAWATCRLPTSATERSPNTPASCPSPARMLQRRTAARADGAAPCEASPTELPQARGRFGFWPFRPPPRRPLAAVDLPQPDWLEHPLSRSRVRLCLKAQPSQTTVRLRSLSNGIAQRTLPKLDPPYGAASCALSRKSTQSAAPEVPSLASASRCREAAASTPRRIAEPWLADAFVTNINTRLDRAGISLARPPRAARGSRIRLRGGRSALGDFRAWNSS